MSKLGRRIWKWTGASLAAVLILLAIGVGIFRVAVPMVPGLRADAEIVAQQAIGWPVHIGEIDLRWAFMGPELVLTDVQLLAPGSGQPLVTAAQLDIVFGPMDLFQKGTPRPSLIRLHQPTLAVERAADGEFVLSGFALPVSNETRLTWREFLDFGLRHGRVTVIDGELHYRDLSREIEDWVLRLPKFSIASDGSTHEFEGSILPPGALGEQIEIAFTAEGRPSLPEEWHWTLNLGVRAMRLNWWYQQFQWAGPADLHGTLDMSFFVSGKGVEGMAGGGKFAFNELHIASRVPAMTANESHGFSRIAMDWEFDYGRERVAVDVSDVEIVSGEQRFDDGSFALRTGGQYPLEFAAARLPVGALSELARFLPVSASDEDNASDALAQIRRQLIQLAPRGDLREFLLGLDLDHEPARFRIETRFDRLGIAPSPNLPGFSGLSGTLRGDEQAGLLRIASSDVVVDTNGLFRTTLPAEQLRGNFQWERRTDAWRILGEDIFIRNPEASANASMTLDIPDEGSPFIDMVVTAHNADFKARSTWLPVGVMPETLVEWLDTAILDGHAPEASLVLRGPLKNYPFRDGSGVFDVRFRAEDTTVKFAPDWPQVENLSANVRFHGAALDITIDRADVVPGLTVEGGHAGYADSADARLDVTAEVSGDTSIAWQFLAQSPLAEPLATLLETHEVAGPMRADVSLGIPMRAVNETAVTVNAELDDVMVNPTALPWTVESLDGVIRITEREISAEQLQGRFTDAPFHASIESETDAAADGFAPTRIRMQGRSPGSAFGEYLPKSWLERLDGEFDWRGELFVPGDGGDVTFQVNSTLEGVTSELPSPLATLPAMRAEISMPGGSRIDVKVVADRLGAGSLRFVDSPRGWTFDRGRLALGTVANVDLGDESGLYIEGDVDVLEGVEWLRLGESQDNSQNDGQGPGARNFLRGLDITSQQLDLGGMTLRKQRVSASRAGTGWDVALSGPARGIIQVPSLDENREPWLIRLEHLHLPSNEGEGTGDVNASPDPRTLPPLDVDIGELRVGLVELGHVQGKLQRTAIGYATQDFSARTGSYQLALDARWEFIAGQHYTSISGILDSTDLAHTLAQLGYRGGLDADNAHVETNIAWHASPMNVDRSLLEGNMNFALRDGSLSEVNPGAGRLLGLLSIAALPRRLTLDFSDFFGKGLHFDTLSGDFLLTGGSAYTTNVVLDGPSVSALLVGRTGLVARDYDQLVIVDPDVSASIPVAGYLAAGPTVGAALLLLSQLLKAPLADITQVKYRISGSWDEPVIERVVQEK